MKSNPAPPYGRLILNSPELSAVNRSENALHARSACHNALLIGASAGGPLASCELLASLAPDGPLPVVLMMHPPPANAMPRQLQELTFEAEWICADSRLAPRRLLLCPPHSFVELLPDGRCTVTPAPSQNRSVASLAPRRRAGAKRRQRA